METATATITEIQRGAVVWKETVQITVPVQTNTPRRRVTTGVGAAEGVAILGQRQRRPGGRTAGITIGAPLERRRREQEGRRTNAQEKKREKRKRVETREEVGQWNRTIGERRRKARWRTSGQTREGTRNVTGGNDRPEWPGGTEP
jgi:hypothetical protein